MAEGVKAAITLEDCPAGSTYSKQCVLYNIDRLEETAPEYGDLTSWDPRTCGDENTFCSLVTQGYQSNANTEWIADFDIDVECATETDGEDSEDTTGEDDSAAQSSAVFLALAVSMLVTM